MEIIPLITYLLLFAVALLLVVIAITMLFSKSSTKHDESGQDLIPANMKIVSQNRNHTESIDYVSSQNNKKLPVSSRNSQIFYMNKEREGNAKSFSTQIKYRKQNRNTEAMGRTRLEGKPRFTIINDSYGIEEYSSLYKKEETKYFYMNARNSAS